MRPQRDFTKALAEGCFPKSTRFFGRSVSSKLFPDSATIPLPVYREFVDMLYNMWLPIFGLGVVFVGVCLLAAFELDEPICFALAALGALTTFLRLAALHSYARVSPVGDIKGLRRWERRYAIGNYASAVLLALLNIMALTAHDSLLHLLTVSLVFSFGAGVVSRISVRPKICVTSLLLATVPTVAALAFHAVNTHSGALHTEMFLMEALLVAMITGLSLQTVAYLYRSAVEHHTAKHDLALLAHCDPLTSLPNRNAMYARITTEIGRMPCSLLMLDLDGFKEVNDSLGHSRGDQLLAAVADRLAAAVAGSGFIARLGGDEFAILLADCINPIKIDEITTRIFESLNPPFELVGQSIYVGISIGIAMAPKDASDVERLLSSADLALYSAKNDGGGVRTFFTRAMQNTSEQKRRLGADLRQALLNNEFEIWYQPQFSLQNYQISGVEALLRWRHPTHGILLPQLFMEVLDESAIAEEVGDWILNQACAAAADWKQTGLKSLRVGVNLFPAQLRSGRLFGVVSSALARHGICASQLEIEITENTVLRNDNQSLNELKKLRALGVGIAFDDFGTGFASLSLLQKYPLTRLKIDRSFVARIDREVGDEAIVTAVIGMARSLGLAVIAEGVETERQEAALARIGCDEVQGYRYGYAMPDREISEKWVEWTRPQAQKTSL